MMKENKIEEQKKEISFSGEKYEEKPESSMTFLSKIKEIYKTCR